MTPSSTARRNWSARAALQCSTRQRWSVPSSPCRASASRRHPARCRQPRRRGHGPRSAARGAACRADRRTARGWFIIDSPPGPSGTSAARVVGLSRKAKDAAKRADEGRAVRPHLDAVLPQSLRRNRRRQRLGARRVGGDVIDPTRSGLSCDDARACASSAGRTRRVVTAHGDPYLGEFGTIAPRAQRVGDRRTQRLTGGRQHRRRLVRTPVGRTVLVAAESRGRRVGGRLVAGPVVQRDGCGLKQASCPEMSMMTATRSGKNTSTRCWSVLGHPGSGGPVPNTPRACRRAASDPTCATTQ